VAIIVEDGTGKVDAESYISVADCDAYHTAFSHAGWTGTTAAKEAALRKATQYVDTIGDRRWIGYRLDLNQALDWPRFDATDDDGWVRASDTVPVEVEQATSEAALRALTEELFTDLPGAGTIGSESVTVGPISTSTTYVGGKTQLKRYTIVEKLLAPLLESSGTVSRG
jgi:hypothetical protein